MVMTVLEGRVAKESWPALEQAFNEGSKQMEPGLVHSYLVHDVKESDIWRILTIWSSREALDEMRKSVAAPTGVLMFRAAQSEPVLSVFNIVRQLPQI